MALIPTENPMALAAYYCGVFSVIPCLGLLPGMAGVILGIVALQAYRHNPKIEGAVHAWIGIVLGGLMTLLWGGGLAAILIGLAASA